MYNGAEGNIDDISLNDNRPIFCASTDEILTNDLLSTLKVEIPYDSKPTNYGIENFVRAKEIIQSYYGVPDPNSNIQM